MPEEHITYTIEVEGKAKLVMNQKQVLNRENTEYLFFCPAILMRMAV
jgi:hypothetical protein